MNKYYLTLISIPLISNSLTAQVVNGDFENSSTFISVQSSSELGTAGYTSSPSSTGWTFGSSAGLLRGNDAQPLTKSGFAGWLNPDGIKGTGATISQVISFSTPGSYSLNFQSFSAVLGKTGTSTFRASIAGTTQNYTEIGDGNYTARSLTFNVNSAGSQTLVFTGTGSSSSVDTLIDTVTIKGVPEPSSTALLGLGALSLMIRRKR